MLPQNNQQWHRTQIKRGWIVRPTSLKFRRHIETSTDQKDETVGIPYRNQTGVGIPGGHFETSSGGLKLTGSWTYVGKVNTVCRCRFDVPSDPYLKNKTHWHTGYFSGSKILSSFPSCRVLTTVSSRRQTGTRSTSLPSFRLISFSVQSVLSTLSPK